MVAFPEHLSGAFLPITTPFGEDGSLDLGALKVNTHLYATSGVHGLLVLGSNGENRSLNEAEKASVLETVNTYRHPNQIMMAGCMGESLAVVLDEIRRAEGLGYGCALVLPPSYFRTQMTDDVLESFFVACADASPMPILMYNALQFSGIELSADLVARVAPHPNVIGFKHSAPSDIAPYVELQSDSFRVMAGYAGIAYPAMQLGVRGIILNLGNVFPRAALRVYELGLEPDSAEGQKYHAVMKEANTRISGTYGVPGVKAAMDIAGLAGLYPRLPLQRLGDAEREDVKQALIESGLL